MDMHGTEGQAIARCRKSIHMSPDVIIDISTGCCGIGSGLDTIHPIQHSIPLSRSSIFSTPYYVVDKQNSIRTFIEKPHIVLEFSLTV